MSPEGELQVSVRWDGAQITGVAVASSRPQLAGRLLAQRTPSEVTDILPRIYAICGRSHAVAAVNACEAALGWAPGAKLASARALVVATEAAQEYLFQALVQWPRLRGEPPPADVAATRDALTVATASLDGACRPCAPDPIDCVLEKASAAMHAAAERGAAAALGSSACAWLVLAEQGAVTRWAETRATPAARFVADQVEAAPDLGASETALLPRADAALASEIAADMDAHAAFERHPSHRGAPAETGALARLGDAPGLNDLVRRWGRSALARCVARLVELARLVTGRAAPLHGRLALARDEGLGWVETARGLLVHRARLERGRVAAYRIVAPTEWNFHPAGALARGLHGARFESAIAAERAAHLLVLSLDPCVYARVEVLEPISIPHAAASGAIGVQGEAPTRPCT